ncbi:MAG: thiamine phosphate synthase [Rhodospirillaceae bacterium]|nr:thiamine phosphate synthase [Rhodospirillaceae bacterium]
MLKRFSTTVAAMAQKSRRKRAGRLPVLFVMTDIQRLPDPGLMIEHLPSESAVVIRHIDEGKRRLLAARVLPRCKARRIKLLIALDWRAAAALRTDGVHLPEKNLTAPPAGLRLWQRAKGIILTAAAHNARAIRVARRNKCDAVFLSPVLPSRSHAARKALGRVRYAQMARQATLPVIALGGIAPNTIRSLNGTRTSGVAGISFAEKF